MSRDFAEACRLGPKDRGTAGAESNWDAEPECANTCLRGGGEVQEDTDTWVAVCAVTSVAGSSKDRPLGVDDPLVGAKRTSGGELERPLHMPPLLGVVSLVDGARDSVGCISSSAADDVRLRVVRWPAGATCREGMEAAAVRLLPELWPSTGGAQSGGGMRRAPLLEDRLGPARNGTTQARGTRAAPDMETSPTSGGGPEGARGGLGGPGDNLALSAAGCSPPPSVHLLRMGVATCWRLAVMRAATLALPPVLPGNVARVPSAAAQGDGGGGGGARTGFSESATGLSERTPACCFPSKAFRKAAWSSQH